VGAGGSAIGGRERGGREKECVRMGDDAFVLIVNEVDFEREGEGEEGGGRRRDEALLMVP